MNTRSIRFRLTVWYSGLLAGLLLVFGASTFFGLSEYLNRSLTESLRNQARQIAESFLTDVAMSGESHVIAEIEEHYAPEMNHRFVRVTRPDGSILYASGRMKEDGFDPSSLPPLSGPFKQEDTRRARLPGGELFIYTLPFTARNGSRFVLEVGAPYG